MTLLKNVIVSSIVTAALAHAGVAVAVEVENATEPAATQAARQAAAKQAASEKTAKLAAERAARQAAAKQAATEREAKRAAERAAKLAASKAQEIPAVAPTNPSADGLTLELGNGVTMLLARIPAGTFLMGSPDVERARSSDEGPQHEVTISKPFFMGMFPVTQGQYQQVMGVNPSVAAKGPEYPVDNVRWEMAVAFCKAASAKTGKTFRLPTEAEFEYATRAGTTTRYYFGDDPDYKQLGDYAWWAKNCKNAMQPVGLKKPNAWGLYDMYNIVWQWCSDWYGDTYPAEKQTDPQGPATGQYRVMRGGCWLTGAHTMDDKLGRMLSRSALRGIPSWYSWGFAPGSAAKLGREYDQIGRIGFRVVVQAP